MIDIQQEQPLSLAQAAKLVPSNRQGKAVNVSTLVRWIQHGVKGVHLDAVRYGSRWVTSREALARFTETLTARHALPSQQEPPTRQATKASRQRRIEQAERELKARGV
jgi:hypothetical protein